MTKSEAQIVVDAIHNRDPHKINVEQGIQLAVNSYVDNLIKQTPEFKILGYTDLFDKKSTILANAFQQAFRVKIKEIRKGKKSLNNSIPVVPEEKFLISEVCKMLEMTSQNLNHLLRKHPEIKVIDVSTRKRYLTKGEINKLRNLNK